jgi:ORF6N domain
MPKQRSPSTPPQQLIPVEAIERRIFLIRSQKVMLDSDLAELYGVATRRLNEQVRRNITRFPADFMFQLTAEEATLRSQFATSKKGRGGRRYAPLVFTEHGVAMLSSVLNRARGADEYSDYPSICQTPRDSRYPQGPGSEAGGRGAETTGPGRLNRFHLQSREKVDNSRQEPPSPDRIPCPRLGKVIPSRSAETVLRDRYFGQGREIHPTTTKTRRNAKTARCVRLLACPRKNSGRWLASSWPWHASRGSADPIV